MKINVMILETALNLLVQHNLGPIEALNKAQTFYTEAISRGFLIPDKCPKCKNDIKIIDLTTTKPEYQARCSCSVATAKNPEDAILLLYSEAVK
jgi:hypothetical protein